MAQTLPSVLLTGPLSRSIDLQYPNLRRAARRYARILSPVLKKYGVEISSHDEASVEEVKKLVESYILETGRRIVILIDDLDRAYRTELLSVLQTVRLTASFQRTLFILAYDEGQISRQLRRLGTSPDFLDKIVQAPIDLPAVDKAEIDRFLLYSYPDAQRSQLDLLFDGLKISDDRRKEFDKRFVELYLFTLSPFFTTLRSAKRFMNSLSVRLSAVKDEVNLLEFVLLEILRVFANSVYQDIWTNSYYYVAAWTLKASLSSPLGLEYDARHREEQSKKIRDHVNGMLGAVPQRDNVLEILKTLFFARVGMAFGSATTYGDDAIAGFRAAKRVSHPDSFEKYFLLAVPKGTMPDATVEALLSGWRDAENAEQAMAAALTNYKDQSLLRELLDRLVVFLNKIDAKSVEPLVRTLTASIGSFSRDGERSENDGAFRLLLFLLEERVADAEKQATLTAVLRDLGPIDIAVRVVNALADSSSASIWRLKQNVELPKLKQVIIERFAKEFISSGKNVFDTSPRPTYILYQIGSYEQDSARAISDYTMSLCEAHPQYIGGLISSFRRQFPGETARLHLDQMKSVFDVKRLAELATKATNRAWTNETEQEAVEMFLKEMLNPRQNSSST